MQLSTRDRDLLALHLVPGIGPRLAAALLAHFGSTAALLKATTAQLRDVPHLPEKVAQQLQQALATGNVDKELALLEEHGVRLVPLGAPAYPPLLATIAVPPRFLYVRGDFETDKAIAIVGSRQCSSYGRRVAEHLAQDLVRAGYAIVSGLARGIDACAHRGALEAKGKTWAVLAGGLAKVYPPEHNDLADEIARLGALVCEQPMQMAPMAEMFPARNRIISGLSRAVIVVEANEKSGALITARHAAEQGREVFAVPGQVDSPTSGGTLKLLREGAKLVRQARDVLEDLEGIAPLLEKTPALPETSVAPPGLDDLERAIWEFLGEPRTVDDICVHTEKPMASLSGVLMKLEMKRALRRLPGNIYERW